MILHAALQHRWTKPPGSDCYSCEQCTAVLTVQDPLAVGPAQLRKKKSVTASTSSTQGCLK